MILLTNSQQGGLEGEARQESAFVWRGCQQRWQPRPAKRNLAGAVGPATPDGD